MTTIRSTMGSLRDITFPSVYICNSNQVISFFFLPLCFLSLYLSFSSYLSIPRSFTFSFYLALAIYFLLLSQLLLLTECRLSFQNCKTFQVKKSFLNSLDIDLDKNGSAVKLLYDNFLLGVKPNDNGTLPWTTEEKSR